MRRLFIACGLSFAIAPPLVDAGGIPFHPVEPRTVRLAVTGKF